MTFFHLLASIHKRSNTIDEVTNDNNAKLTKIEEIRTWDRNYFKNSYKEEHRTYNREDRQ